MRCPVGRGGAQLADFGRQAIAAGELPATLRFEVAAATAADPGPGPQTAQKRPRSARKPRKRPRTRPEPLTAAPEALAQPERAKKRPPTPAERRRAWAFGNQLAFEAMLRDNAAAVTELIGRPVLTLPEAEELDAVAEIVAHFVANDRHVPILAADLAGAPAVHLREDRLPAVQTTGRQAALPFVPEEPGHVLPVLLRRRGELDTGGNGPVPLAWRFWYESLLSAPLGAYAGRAAILRPTVNELITFAGWKRFQPHKHVPALADALEALYDLRIPYRGTAWIPVMVRNIPASYAIDREVQIQIEVRLPTETRYGPQIDRQALRSLAVKSFPRYRGLLGLSAYWDQYGDGRGGADATADNPNRDRWPVLTPEALRLMMFPGKEHREYRARAVRHAQAMNRDGVIDLVEEPGGGVRIFRPA